MGEYQLDALPPKEFYPKHIGIIMDGNGRWAKQHKVPRELGHKEGAKTFEKIIRYCKEIGIPYVTVYAFSTENWSRPQNEVEALMNLFSTYLSNSKNYLTENVRLHIIGDCSKLSDEIQKKIIETEQLSMNNDGLDVNVAINYGGRDEIVHAVNQIISTKNNCTITEEMIAKNLYTAGQPDPDLIIRPSGEQRLSNFMLWQAAYSEFVFMDVLWPDFTAEHLNYAITEFAKRNRRFGGRNNEN